jgi:hypothetical protein
MSLRHEVGPLRETPLLPASGARGPVPPTGPLRADRALLTRAAAARELVACGRLDGWEALREAVWPSPKLEALYKR